MGADFSLDRFERVDASPTTALLRVSGWWAASPGKRADLVAFPLPGNVPDPLAAILDDDAAAPSAVWIAGRAVRRIE